MLNDLIKLMTENPELPVIPMVDTEVVCGDEYGYWMASFGECSVREFVSDYYNEGIIRYKDEADAEDKLIENIAECKYDGTLEDYERARKEVAEMWAKAIIVKIELPD